MSSVPIRGIEFDSARSWQFTMWNDTPRVKPEWADDAALIMAMLNSNVNRQKSPQERNREIGWRFMIEHFFKEEERLLKETSIQWQLDQCVRTLRRMTSFELLAHEKFRELCEKHGDDYAFAHAVKKGWIKQAPPKSARIVYEY